MIGRDSMVYLRITRICKRHLHWVGLSEAARDVLATLLVEHYWSEEPISSEELALITGYSRGSISVAISQLRTLGFIESRIDTSHQGRGRKPTYYVLTEGLSGLVMFGVRRLSLELEGMLGEVEALKASVQDDDGRIRGTLSRLEDETAGNLERLRKYIRQIRAARVLSETFPTE
ncbi:MAG: hypothetical protein KAR33_01205 [Candidatus Thorarchaeota archaeon]|nr:hypothetical protein [Candidatus Thorarchaeota archaeon]